MLSEYLALLGVAHQPPSAAYLAELHRAHVSKVVYANVDIMLGRPGTLDPVESVRRIVQRRGGYCFQLNGAFAWLLRELGFSVTLHRGYVWRHDAQERPNLNHLVLVVHDLDGPPWLVDAGLGDAIYDPLPLVPGEFAQGPFRYALGAAPGFDGWRFTHDAQGSFAAMEFESAAASLDDFVAAHQFQSTSPESSFTKFLTAQVRLPGEVAALRGLVLTTVDKSGKRSQTMETLHQWQECLTALGVDAGAVTPLWEREQSTHAEWLAKA